MQDFRIRLKDVVSSSAGFKLLSDWMIEHCDACNEIVSVWRKELEAADAVFIDRYFRLLNLVVRHRKGRVYVPQFLAIIEDTFTSVTGKLTTKDEEIWNKLQEMVHLWHNQDIFGPQVGDRLQRCLDTNKKMSRLHETFPSRSNNELASALSSHQGNVEAAAEALLGSEMMVTPSGSVNWADLVDEDIPEYEPLPSPSAPTSHSTARRKEKKLEVESKAHIRTMEQRVRALEETVAAQSTDLSKIAAGHAKLEEFVKEMRLETAKLMQRQFSEGPEPRRRSLVSRPSTSPRLNPSAAPFIPGGSEGSTDTDSAPGVTDEGADLSDDTR
eukprot:TRINITY_DN5691_c0_g1_i1.p1 TRINITY_DN5691_c0_g1~~TRINITY_DN5691_c0_g1_i1.p1  ORF type:complete len:328 (-),score=59.52 TRINITY_DN5691_c0_g1_i1:104-1087(-)